MKNHRPKIILGPVQNLHDARYAAAVGIDYLLFNLQGDFAHTPEDLLQIKGWISGPSLILKLDSDAGETRDFLQKLNPSMIILPDGITPVTPFPLIRMRATADGSATPTVAVSDEGPVLLLNSPDDYFIPRAESPFAWWLGTFSLTPEGLLDYEACDAFLQRAHIGVFS